MGHYDHLYEETEMAVKKKRVKEEGSNFQWVGVRFMEGNAGISQIYTYKVKKGVKLFRGQELVVHNQKGASIVVVVQVGKEPDIASQVGSMMNWKWITEKVADL